MSVSDQMSDKICCLIFRGGKTAGRELAFAMRAYLATGDQAKTGEQPQKGKQSLKQLTADGAKLENIELCSETVKQFERTARKYEVDYAIKKATLDGKPVNLAFFKSRDAATMDAAFREYSAQTLCKSATKPTLRETLAKAAAKAKTQVIEKAKEKVHQVTR